MKAACVGLVLLTLAACAGQQEPYFEPDTGLSIQHIPIAMDEIALTGFTRIEAKAGDRIELLDAAPTDLVGDATVRPYVLPMSETGGGGVGAMRLSEEWEPGVALDALWVPFDGFVLTPETGMIQIVFATTPVAPGRITWDHTRLRFRVDGQERSQEWPYGARVCAGDPQPDDCPYVEGEPAPSITEVSTAP
jgi:hypothetical protein